MNTATPKSFRDDNNAQPFGTGIMEGLIAEARQFGISMTLAHHRCMSELSANKANALSSVGATIMFRANSDDTQRLRKNL